MTRTILAGLILVLAGAQLPAQPLFKEREPLALTLTTNLRDLVRERDSTELRWFGAEMQYTDASGATVRLPVELRARGHFRRQSRNCSFPPLFLRAERSVRDSSILQGNPRLKITTPCRPEREEYQQYVFLEYLVYQTYAAIDSVHHRTRLATITYRDSTDRVKPITVSAFFLEIEDEVADEHGLELVEQKGALFADVVQPALDRLSIFEFWIGNTDWSLSALHNITLFQTPERQYVPVAYDFDWSGAVNARYSFPQANLGIRTVRDRLHRGPCKTAEQWAPTVEHYLSRRAAVDSIWAQPIAGLDPKKLADSKKWLDELWPILTDPRQFKRNVIDRCQPRGN
ncbi:MAG: hypothetical protein KJZ74_06520 [Gemmatimonadales bacterium]|nr:hypothetical protein [Gemmatimonadales bacterium]